jgi:predicted outer membrane protein
MTASRPTTFTIASVAMFCVVATVWPANATQPNLSGGDRTFAQEMAENNAAEAAAASLAQKLTERGDIRSFAQDALDERAATDAQLRAVASQDGLNLSLQPSAAAQGNLKELAGLHGAAFDRRFIADTERALQDDLSGAAQEARNGVNPGLQYIAVHRRSWLLAQQRLLEQISAGSTIGAEPAAVPLGWQYQPPPSH